MTCAFVLLTTWGGDGPSIENNIESLVKSCHLPAVINMPSVIVITITDGEFQRS